MAKMITANTARSVGILVSALFPQEIVFTLNLMFVLTSTLFKLLSNPKEKLFWYNFSISLA